MLRSEFFTIGDVLEKLGFAATALDVSIGERICLVPATKRVLIVDYKLLNYYAIVTSFNF
jgi:hypothetical protein